MLLQTNSLLLIPMYFPMLGRVDIIRMRMLNYKLKDSHFPGESITKHCYASLS